MDPATKTSHVITDRLLRSWIRCNRKAWLDLHGNPQQRIWTAHTTLQLDQQHQIFAEFLPDKAGKGLSACQKGTYGVIGLRIRDIDPSGKVIEAHPALLQRIKGESRWGAYSYRPVLARQGKKLTKEYRLVLAFTGLILKRFQEAKVTHGLVISKTNTGLEFQEVSLNEKLENQLIEYLQKLYIDIKKYDPPPLTTDRRKCTICSWKSICDVQAAAEGDLSEVSGIGQKRKQILKEIGINKIQELATVDPLKLTLQLKHYGEQHSEISEQLVTQALSQFNKTKNRISPNPCLPELKNAQGVLLYDIESDPDLRDDFLHGFIAVHRNKIGNWDLTTAKYQPILVLKEHGPDLCWKRLKRKLKKYHNWPILHYGETEEISLMRLAKMQKSNEEELQEIRNRFIDIHYRLRMGWQLPLNNYGLKTVANWIDFKWEQKGATGARALLWSRQWKKAKKRIQKERILKRLFIYNRDDCLATWAVASWLIEQDEVTC